MVKSKFVFKATWVITFTVLQWGCTTSSSDDDPPTQADAGYDAGGDGGGSEMGTPDIAAEPVPPGSSCVCDSDCETVDGHAGICVYGVCMTRASADCSESGSSAECPAGSRCWGLQGAEGSICWPDCASYPDCAGTCDADGSCFFSEETSALCSLTCASYCDVTNEPCSPSVPDGYCSDGQSCDSGVCVDNCSPTHPTGYCPELFDCDGERCISTTGCPSWECTGADCQEIIQMTGSRNASSVEAQTAGYYIATDERYSYLRRDVAMIMQWALCELRARYPDVPPLALADMTNEDGTTPGCERGSDYCRHPEGTTHTGGDIDTAYYQTDGANNTQIICGDGSDNNANGRPGEYNDGYFCTTEENIVNIEQQIAILDLIGSTGWLYAAGIDETLADDLSVSDAPLGYGAEGYWQFHHHHVHWSFYW